MPVAPSTRLGRYEIRALLGAGGMGEVYLARDTELERAVAIKLLNVELVSNQQRMQRFVQEAKAASALNHPNILTIYEIGRADSVRFIATEFIDGVTLRERMAQERLRLSEVLEIATQVASALAAAHGAGIVHRDIKPENIMLRHDGYIKVLDFGLAKLTEQSRSRRSTDSEATTIIETEPGVVMGTVQYMSPEQVRGLRVDARADVFSLGVVMYEMVAGRRPFEGATTSDVIVSILEKEPVPLKACAPEAPAELGRVVTKALAKVAEDRYQTIKEMAIDLRRLKRELEVEAGRESSAQPTAKSGETTAVSSSQPMQAKTDVQAAARVSEAVAPRKTSRVEYLFGEIKRHKMRAALVSAALILLSVGVTYGLYRLLRQPEAAVVPFRATKVTRLTSTGKARQAAISPDGKQVVYAEGENRQQSLWIKQVATGSNVQIVPPADAAYVGLTYSNDGNYVYYVRYEPANSLSVLYQVPSLGGVSKKLMERVGSAIAFSPDGKRLAFVRSGQNKGETEMVLANADGSAARTLATRKAPDSFSSNLGMRVAWSPDGKTIACAANSSDADGYYQNVVGVSVEDGAEKPLTAQRWQNIGQVAWLSDGSGLVMDALEKNATQPTFQVWHLSYPGGEARQITNDLNRYSGVSLTARSDALVTVQKNRVSNIWLAPAADASRARQITSGTLDGTLGLNWTPDGKIVYESRASGKIDIWTMDADGSNQRRLTHDGLNGRPTVSRDGRHIVFWSDRAGRINIWRMDVDGSNPKQLTDGKSNAAPHLSPDGRWVVYMSYDHGSGALWKVPIDGGEPVRLNDVCVNLPTVSPDGKQIACFYGDEQAIPPHGVMLLPFTGGAPTRRFNISLSSGGFVLNWTPDSRALLYIDTRLSNIWSQPVDGGGPAQLTDFQGDQLFNFDYSPDGKWLAFARGRATDDVILIEDSGANPNSH